MSFLRRKERRRSKVAAAATTVAALAAFQALAIVGATNAFAITDCDFTLSTGAVACTIDPGNSLGLTVESTADLDPLAAPGSILQSVNGGPWQAIGSASNANTTSIDLKGSNGTDETFYLVNGPSATFGTAGDEFSTSIKWSVDLGTGTADAFYIFGSDDLDDEIVGTDTSFTMNGAGGPIAGMEQFWVFPGDGDDVVDNSALSTNVVTVIVGEDGDDWIAPGAFNGDIVDGDGGAVDGYDQLSYGTRTTCTVIDNAAGISGHDANCDGDLLDVGDEVDNQGNFEVLETGSGNDSIYGLAAVDEWYIPGDGDDYIAGNAADDDVIDYSSSSAAMTIDPGLGTATGQGDDEFDDVYGFVGSDFDDVLLWDADVWGFAGGDGLDTVDASAKTSGQVIDLDTLDDLLTADSTEDAIGGSGDDVLTGNDLRNVLTGNDGNDRLVGAGGNDTFFGGLGNDTFTGNEGADTVDFGASPAAITADISLGFASGEGDDSIAGIEVVKGSPFADFITGGGASVAVNFWITGRAGNDNLTGSNGNDYLKGGAGNDKVRGGAGDDSLYGGKGNDKGWGGRGTDFCKGFEWHKGCE